MIQHHMLKHFLFLQISVLQLYTAPHGYQEEPEISGRNFWISGRLQPSYAFHTENQTWPAGSSTINAALNRTSSNTFLVDLCPFSNSRHEFSKR